MSLPVACEIKAMSTLLIEAELALGHINLQ